MIPNNFQGIIKNYIFNNKNDLQSNLEAQTIILSVAEQSVESNYIASNFVIIIGRLKASYTYRINEDLGLGKKLLTLLNTFFIIKIMFFFMAYIKILQWDKLLKTSICHQNTIKFIKLIEFGGIA